ncbi:glutathione S-transferase family protein [Candidatus Uabimicrobium sp. HlEnr_7]|uniref:glutathione S-transferase family protein n=1 Tax=Candidatus Uabimicrobium helgolandensis TaxID=3095367 RepID=UPI003555FDE6
MKKITFYTMETSPYAAKVYYCLIYKQLIFETVYVNPFKMKQQLPFGKQVPVLTIDDKSFANSTDICLWLDEEFPDKPLVPANLKKQVADFDHWISETLIPLSFYSVYPTTRNLTGVYNAWKLGRTVKKTTQGEFSSTVVLLWPLVLRYAPFIKKIYKNIKKRGSISKVREICLDHLEKSLGPFLIKNEHITIVDIFVYSQFALPRKLGLLDSNYFLNRPKIRDWYQKMERLLVENTMPKSQNIV